ncbi:DUF952 domain-containing protein [Paracoccus suum]|uniref:DUF952 domain-containing protein n=1 Tax=Paracoccus suum TaxID=2259340 RepID=A0A344PLT0_9RHOB|nr:DUF952 domain-containing protein [Paracoccus suum]AXC50335.1 DUF952 domain-containing protein [Paracoccus suum]
MLIFKILRPDEWDAYENTGRFTGAPIDVSDGYIHFSTAEQLAATAAKHFTREDGLILAAFDADALGQALQWEPARGGDLFPHLYRALTMEDLVWSRRLPLGPEGHVLGDLT